MQQRDLVINAVLLVLIGAVSYLLITFKPSDLNNPDWLVAPRGTQPAGVSETRFGASTPRRAPEQLAFVRNDPMRTIIPTQTPKPRTPTPTPRPPKLAVVMPQQFQLVMPDPPHSVMLLDKTTKQMTTWKVNEKRVLKYARGGTVEATLVKVDSNDFSVHFTAPEDEGYVFRFFQP